MSEAARPSQFPSPKQTETPKERLYKYAQTLEQYFDHLGYGVPVREIVDRTEVEFQGSLTEGSTNSHDAEPQMTVPIESGITLKKTSIHELSHLSSRSRRGQKTSGLGFGAGNPLKFFRTSKYPKYKLFEALNEAVTDEIAHRTVEHEQPNALRKAWLNFSANAYKRERAFLKHVIKNLAHARSVEEEEVFREFVGVYVEGWSREFKEHLITTFGPGTLKVLAVIEASTHAFPLFDRTALDNPDFKEALYTFFDLKKTEQDRVQAQRTILAIAGV